MPEWLSHLHESHPVAHAIAVLSLVALTGMALGSLKIRGVRLGVAAVLFSGILVGHLGESIDPRVLEFTKDFGLILFVFTIGLQLGPGFFAALRSQGLTLNLLALAIVLLGTGATVAMAAVFGLDRCIVPGLLAGAATNTPSLAAGQQALAALPGISEDRAALPALAYAVAYPMGAFGVIGCILLLKRLFRIDPQKEAAAARTARQSSASLERRTLVVTNPGLVGTRMGDIPGRRESGVIISRVRPAGGGEVLVAIDSTEVHLGDALLAVGPRFALDQLQRVVGAATDENLLEAPGEVSHRRVFLTNRSALGKTVPELALDQSFGVVVSRITRSDLEMTAVPGLRLQFGDSLQIVGPAERLDKAAASLGNSVRALNETHFVPLFAGILVGVLVGTVPIAVPGLPTPLRLGLAGGPLIVAMIVGRIGHLGPLVWHMPTNANLAFRELGIVLFLASVGLIAGPRFVEMAFSPTGAVWLLAAACIAWVPLLIIGILARQWLKLDFATLSGLLAGSTTNPPALAFANALSGSDTPSVAYATVYPLTMILRVVIAQVIVLILLA
jgi:putative transport protein